MYHNYKLLNMNTNSSTFGRIISLTNIYDKVIYITKHTDEKTLHIEPYLNQQSIYKARFARKFSR